MRAIYKDNRVVHGKSLDIEMFVVQTRKTEGKKDDSRQARKNNWLAKKEFLSSTGSALL